MTRLYFALNEALVALSISGEHCQYELKLAGRQPQCAAVDPLQPQLVYCGTRRDGLWRSEDAGQTWQPASNGIPHSHISAVALSRSERVAGRGIVYIGTEPSAVFRSEDAGRTWGECRGLNELPSANEWSFPPRPSTHHVRWIEPDPHVAGRLFVAVEAGALIRSPDGGETWQDRTPDGPRDTHQMVIHPAAPDRLYSAAGDGYFESRDGGKSWQRIEEGLQHRYVWSIAVDAADPNTSVISSAASARHSHYKPAESFIYRRTGNLPWQVVRDGLPEPQDRRTAVLAAHPAKPATFYAAWENDMFRSTDAGASWERLDISWPDEFRFDEICALVVAESKVPLKS